MKKTKLKVRRRKHPMYQHMPTMFGISQYIYSMGKDRISLILFNTLKHWAWELLGGKFKDPERFSSKEKAEKAIRERYGIRKE